MNKHSNYTPTANKPCPLGLRVLCLLALAVFFFASYGAANHYAASLPDVPSLWFAWEKNIPLLAWTIVPYWSIDFFYGLSILLCATTLELRRHALRLFTAQLISVACFVLFPLKFAFVRPALDGVFGQMFDVLMGFDKPFNQAPSLHISLLLILWAFYVRRTSGLARWLVNGWSLLIGLSVLTTWQHHFIDVPTGLFAGLICMWLWPMRGDIPLAHWQKPCARSLRLSAYYALGAGVLCALAYSVGKYYAFAWLLYWPAWSCTMYALAYAGWGAKVLQKSSQGKRFAAFWLFLPMELALWLNSRFWTRHAPAPIEVLPHVYLGRLPSPWQPTPVLIDMTAELSAPCAITAQQGTTYRNPGTYRSIPCLDLLPPSTASLTQAVQALTELRRQYPEQKILVACALGYSRSALVLCAYLLHSGVYKELNTALAAMHEAGCTVVFSPAHRQLLQQMQAKNMVSI